MNLPARLEAILFYRNEPISLSDLAKLTDTNSEQVSSALDELRERLNGGGLTLVEEDGVVALVTAPEQGSALKELAQLTVEGDLTSAELETLTIILYYGPVSKADIDYIRGVNSSTILRKVQVRGLVKKVSDPDRSRGVLYTPTVQAIRHLGIEKREELPEYDKIRDQFGAFADPEKDDADNPFVSEEKQG